MGSPDTRLTFERGAGSLVAVVVLVGVVVLFDATAVPFFTNIAAFSALLLAVTHWYWGRTTDRVTVTIEKRVATN